MPSIKVLSIDGGGIRGILPAMILGALVDRLGGGDLASHFDLIAGTSTGGIIAVGIGTACNNGRPYSPAALVNMYVSNGPDIFKQGPFTDETQVIRPKYSPDALEQVLATFFGEADLASALTPLLISSYDLQGQIPFFFKSHRIAGDASYNWKVREAARATSAAPTYFPPLHLTRGTDDYALVDGGVYVNNPAMAAYAEARSLYPEASEFVVVAVGTGDRQDNISYAESKDWGLLGWAKQLVPVFMDSVSEAVDYQLKYMPGCKYYRLQISHLQAAEGDMDNVTPENLENLQATAREYVQLPDIKAALDEIAGRLNEGRGSNMPGIGRKSA
jgi:uncharacterized protein